MWGVAPSVCGTYCVLTVSSGSTTHECACAHSHSVLPRPVSHSDSSHSMSHAGARTQTHGCGLALLRTPIPQRSHTRAPARRHAGVDSHYSTHPHPVAVSHGHTLELKLRSKGLCFLPCERGEPQAGGRILEGPRGCPDDMALQRLGKNTPAGIRGTVSPRESGCGGPQSPSAAAGRGITGLQAPRCQERRPCPPPAEPRDQRDGLICLLCSSSASLTLKWPLNWPFGP